MSLHILPVSELPVMAEIASDSFRAEASDCLSWIERSGVTNWRVLYQEGELVCGLMRIPLAQWFGGRKVTMMGIAGVAVADAYRGRGLGQSLMRCALKEAYSEGIALSVLYGSTTSFYRRCGYQRAGSRFLAEVSARDIAPYRTCLSTRSLSASDFACVAALQASATRHHGALARNPYLWSRLQEPGGKKTQSFGFFRGDILEGYATLIKASDHLEDGLIEATDVVLTSAEALKSFLGLLSARRTFASRATWPALPNDPILFTMSEPWSYKLTLHEHWMLRLVNLQQAIEERGYPDGLVASVQLQIDDPWFEDNDGRWILNVAGGRARLKRGGDGELRLDIGALASLYTGFMTAEGLAIAGKAFGTAATLAAASSIFAGFTPYLTEFF